MLDVLYDNTRRLSLKLRSPDQMGLMIRLEYIVFVSVPILTVLTGAYLVVPGYLSRQEMVPVHDFTGNSDVHVTHCVAV